MDSKSDNHEDFLVELILYSFLVPFLLREKTTLNFSFEIKLIGPIYLLVRLKQQKEACL